MTLNCQILTETPERKRQLDELSLNGGRGAILERILRLKCDGTRAEIRFRLSTKRTSPFKSTGASVQSTTGSRGVGSSVSNAVLR